MGVNKVVEAMGGGWYKLPDGSKVRGKAAAMAKAERATNESLTAGRFRALRQAGFQYQGVRDVYKTAGYVPEGMALISASEEF